MNLFYLNSSYNVLVCIHLGRYFHPTVYLKIKKYTETVKAFVRDSSCVHNNNYGMVNKMIITNKLVRFVQDVTKISFSHQFGMFRSYLARKFFLRQCKFRMFCFFLNIFGIYIETLASWTKPSSSRLI